MPMEQNYTKFTALEFAQELSFIRWVRHSDEEASRFWEAWVRTHPEHHREIELAKKLVLALRVREAAIPPDALDRMWSQIDAQTQAPTAQSRRLPMRRLLSYAAAAAVTGLVLFFSLFNNPAKVVHTANAERMALDLPDGSQVEVSAATELSYKPGSWKKERRIVLKGEAFFKVAKGQPFVVETELGTVRVLGTSFNVKARDGQFEVDCFTGKVGVKSKNSTRILTPGLSTHLQENQPDGILIQPTASNPVTTATWRNGRFYFEEATMQVVFDELCRQYDIEVQADPAILQRKTTTFFEVGNLDSALYKVCWPMQLKTTRKGRTIVVE